MINSVYQLVAPRTFAVKFENTRCDGRVVIRPKKMAICHADQRYYQGRRDPKVLRSKLPMALIHECFGEVVYDPAGCYSPGDSVVLIPNVPGEKRQGIYENYTSGSKFLSSGYDGFMRELVPLDRDRVVLCEGIDPNVAAVTEFVSVAVHACRRFASTAHDHRKRIAVIGDGALSYILCCVLSVKAPDTEIIVVGRNSEKLSLFSFVSERYFSNSLPDDLCFDHAFECCGGEGSADAIETVICHVNPQGSLMLMGVSEYPVPVFTRNVLEKGMTLIGCSRSGREDFEEAVSIMQDVRVQGRLRQVIYEDEPVKSVGDAKRVFATDLLTPFKTVFGWEM